jgi:malonyl-CoA O-methyltransferase
MADPYVSIPLEDDVPVPNLDPVAARRWMSRIPVSSPWLHEEVGRRMVERLQWFRQLPGSWLHWEPGNGGLQLHRLLEQQLPGAQSHIWSETSALMESLLAGSSRRRPGGWWGRKVAKVSPSWHEPTPVDMVWANMCLHLEIAPQALLRRWHRLVRPDGFLMFSCLGPDSLQELRVLYRQQGWHSPGHPLTDMHDWGDMLVRSGFAEPVMDMERIVLTWSTAEAMLAELRKTGRNLHASRPAGLHGRSWRQALVTAIEEKLPRSPDGRLQLTFEIIYGHAYQGEPRRKDPARVPLEDMRAMLRRRQG